LIKLPPSKGNRGRRYRAFQKSVSDAVAENTFDLIQTHERLLTADIFRSGDGVHAAWLDRLKRNRPWPRNISMNTNPLHRLYMETERRMARETDMIFVAISSLVARELRDWLDVPDERIRIIENGVDLTRFRPATPEQRSAARDGLGIKGDGPVVSYVGSGFERKGAFQLVRALSHPQLDDVTAFVAGRDRAEKSLMRLINQLGLAKRVIMTGAVSDVRPLLDASDLFVLPTMYDPGPNAVLEALASGLPVVTTPDTGVAQMIVDSGAGRISGRDPEALADAIHQTLGELALARDAALSLRPKLDLSFCMDKWLDLYRELS
jgi:UDP-glucose:(heptosyl)LPS alpha-1,3-glucosyltransferase